MKINILYKFQQGPWGGGNQFLKALKKEFEKRNVYEENLKKADVILFNSYPFEAEGLFDKIFQLKRSYSNKILIHRVDGPVFYTRGRDRLVDEMIYQFNELLADGTVFISRLSRKDNYNLGMKKPKYEIVILSAPNPTIFNSKGKKPFNKNKIKLISSSWSGNIRKGFDIYKFLDENLDFSRYTMTFVGNSPVGFENIEWIKPVPSEELAKILKEHDIYITASKYEPFGQAVIEALCCGLPAVVRVGGGYLEATGDAVETFRDKNDILNAIEKVAKNYQYYQSQIPEFSISKVAEKYYDFAEKIYQYAQQGKYKPKKVDLSTKVNFLKMKLTILKWRGWRKLKSILKGK